MKEADWYAWNDIREMLNYLTNKVSMRKMRLFAIACCREIDSLLPHEVCRTALATAERAAEEEDVRQEQRELDAILAGLYLNWETRQRTQTVRQPSENFDQEGAAILAVRWCIGVPSWSTPQYVSDWTRRAFARNAIGDSTGSRLQAVWGRAIQEQARRQIHLLRDIVGQPTRPTRKRTARSLNDVRLDPQVQRLAQVIYRERDFAALPVLADALEDAGCTVEEVLSHCRSGGKHVLGCWALDMLVGKE